MSHSNSQSESVPPTSEAGNQTHKRGRSKSFRHSVANFFTSHFGGHSSGSPSSHPAPLPEPNHLHNHHAATSSAPNLTHPQTFTRGSSDPDLLGVPIDPSRHSSPRASLTPPPSTHLAIAAANANDALPPPQSLSLSRSQPHSRSHSRSGSGSATSSSSAHRPQTTTANDTPLARNPLLAALAHFASATPPASAKSSTNGSLTHSAGPSSPASNARQLGTSDPAAADLLGSSLSIVVTPAEPGTPPPNDATAADAAHASSSSSSSPLPPGRHPRATSTPNLPMAMAIAIPPSGAADSVASPVKGGISLPSPRPFISRSTSVRLPVPASQATRLGQPLAGSVRSESHLAGGVPVPPEIPDYFFKMRTAFGASAVKHLSPSVVGPEHFVKIRLLGKGDVGKVYLVRRKGTNKLYAMKVLSKSEMVKRKKVPRVLTEHDILTSSNHPFLVTLYHSFQTPRNLYFALEFCLGGEFFRALQSRPGRCLPEPEARFYVAEVVLALEYLHMQGYIYRDLKPENILLHASGHIKLADFDLSKKAMGGDEGAQALYYEPAKAGGGAGGAGADTDAFVRHFRTNSFVGTEEYIAPEVIQGHGHSSMVDWWCLGILTYELIYGRTPFKSKNRNATFMNVLSKDISFPVSANPVSTNARALMRKLLHKTEAKRLGGKRGAQEIKEHAWFKSIPWPLLRNLTPPIVPGRDKWTMVTDSLAANDKLRAEREAEGKDMDGLGERAEGMLVSEADLSTPGGGAGGGSAASSSREIRSEDSKRSSFKQEVFDPADIGLASLPPAVATAASSKPAHKPPPKVGVSPSVNQRPSVTLPRRSSSSFPTPAGAVRATGSGSRVISRVSRDGRTSRLGALRAQIQSAQAVRVAKGDAAANGADGQDETTLATVTSSASQAPPVVDAADPFAPFTSLTLLHGDDLLDESVARPPGATAAGGARGVQGIPPFAAGVRSLGRNLGGGVLS